MNTTTKKRKVYGRWNKGQTRYTPAQDTENAKYREPAGWRNGARVAKR